MTENDVFFTWYEVVLPSRTLGGGWQICSSSSATKSFELQRSDEQRHCTLHIIRSDQFKVLDIFVRPRPESTILEAFRQISTHLACNWQYYYCLFRSHVSEVSTIRFVFSLFHLERLFENLFNMSFVQLSLKIRWKYRIKRSINDRQANHSSYCSVV